MSFFQVVFRSMKIIESLKNSNLNDDRTRLLFVEAHRLVSRCYSSMNLDSLSEEFSREVSLLVGPLNDVDCSNRSDLNLSRSLTLKGNFEESSAVLKTILERTQSEKERIFLLEKLTENFLLEHDFERAKQTAFEALDIGMKNRDELILIDVFILLGRVFFESKHFHLAEQFFRSAQRAKDKIGDLDQMDFIENSFKQIEFQRSQIVEHGSSSVFPRSKENFQSKFSQNWISTTVQLDEEKQRNNVSADSNEFLSSNLRDSSLCRFLTVNDRFFEFCSNDRRRTTNRRLFKGTTSFSQQ